MHKTTLSRTRHADDALAAAAREAIRWLTTIPEETIRVNARDGWLNLEGKVAWRHQRNTIEDVTRHLPGVKGVTNSIQIESDRAFAEAKAALA